MAQQDGSHGKSVHEYTIIVNGRERTIDQKKVGYRDIVPLAYPDPNYDNFLYTVTYIKGEGGHEGTLLDGETVPVQNEMVFNVRRSDKS